MATNTKVNRNKMGNAVQVVVSARKELEDHYKGPMDDLNKSAEKLVRATSSSALPFRSSSDDYADSKERLAKVEAGLKAAENLPKDLCERIKPALEKERDDLIQKLDSSSTLQKIKEEIDQAFKSYINAASSAAKIAEEEKKGLAELRMLYNTKEHAEIKSRAEGIKSKLIALKASEKKLGDDDPAVILVGEKIKELEEELEKENSCLQIYEEAKNLLDPLPEMEAKISIPPITPATSPEKAEEKPPVVEIKKPEVAEKKAPKKEHEAELLVFQRFLKTGLPIVNAIGSKEAWKSFVEKDYLEKLSFNEIVSLCSFLCSEMATKLKVSTAFYEAVIDFIKNSEGDAQLVEKLVDAELIKEGLVGRTPVRFKTAEEYAAVISAYINDYINGRDLKKYKDSRFIFNDEKAIKSAYAGEEVA